MKPLYTARATAVGGREGRVRSEDNVLDLQLAIPKGLGGPGGAATNPEQLFAAGYSACFDSALRLIARLKKVPITTSEVKAAVTIGSTEQGGYALAAELIVSLPGVPRADAEALVQAAHQVCPYSVATRGNMDVKLTVAA
jgi:osmotically inducible protein OsmC